MVFAYMHTDIQRSQKLYPQDGTTTCLPSALTDVVNLTSLEKATKVPQDRLEPYHAGRQLSPTKLESIDPHKEL